MLLPFSTFKNSSPSPLVSSRKGVLFRVPVTVRTHRDSADSLEFKIYPGFSLERETRSQPWRCLLARASRQRHRLAVSILHSLLQPTLSTFPLASSRTPPFFNGGSHAPQRIMPGPTLPRQRPNAAPRAPRQRSMLQIANQSHAEARLQQRIHPFPAFFCQGHKPAAWRCARTPRWASTPVPLRAGAKVAGQGFGICFFFAAWAAARGWGCRRGTRRRPCIHTMPQSETFGATAFFFVFPRPRRIPSLPG